MTKKWKKFTPEKKQIFWGSKTTIYISLGLHKGRPSCRETFNSQKRTYRTSKHEFFSTFVGHFCPTGSGSGSTGSGSATLWETRLKGRFSINQLAWEVILIWRPCRYGRNDGLKLLFFSLRIRIRIFSRSRIRIKVMTLNQDPELHESKSRELMRLTIEPWRLTLRPRRLTMELWWLTTDLIIIIIIIIIIIKIYCHTKFRR